MLLKKIAISGFKSFADRVEFQFSHNISGIIGPNGSGKSNIIDAVRWVMGEQNAKLLRGERSVDLIFSGSEHRKPLGMAEVSLTFDNSDKSLTIPQLAHEREIKLTRRVYLDGRKEQTLNNQSCRLRDLIEFFSISELGSKSYSMIQQGQVDRILNAKPEDIREIIEEAAGTVVFRRKKAETEKKLESAKLNLSRIEDIAHELEQQQQTLKDQAEKAKQWQALSAQHAKIEQQMLAYRFQDLQNKLTTVLAELRAENRQEIVSYQELQKIQSKRNDLLQQQRSIEPQIQQIARETEQIQNNRHEFETTLVKLNLQKENSAKRVRELGDEIATTEEELGDNERELKTQQRAHATLAKQLQRTINALAQATADLEHLEQQSAAITTKQTEYQDETESLQHAASEVSVACKVAQNNSRQAQQALDSLKQQLQSNDAKLSTSYAQRDKLKASMLVHQRGLGFQEERKHMLTKHNENLQQQRLTLEAKRDAAKEEYFKHKATYDSAANTLQAHVSGETTTDDRRLKALADYIAFDKKIATLPPKLIRAFEHWAEQIVLVSYEDGLRFGVEFAGFGTANALLLSALPKVNYSDLRAWQQHYNVEPIYSYLEVREPVRSLCKRVFISLDLHVDVGIWRDMPASVYLLTAQGAWCTADGRLAVVRDDNVGIISQQQRVEQLRTRVTSKQEQLAQIQSEIDNLHGTITKNSIELADIEREIASNTQGSDKIATGFRAVVQRIEHEEGVKDSLTAEAERLAVVLQQSDQEVANLHTEQEGLAQELRELKQDIRAIKSDYQRYQKQRDSLQAKTQELALEKMQVQTNADTLAAAITEKQNHISSISTRLHRYYDDHARYQEEGKRAVSDSKQYRQSLANLLHAQEDRGKQLHKQKETLQLLIEAQKKTAQTLAKQQRQHATVQKNIALKSAHKAQLEESISSVQEQAQVHEDSVLEKTEIPTDLDLAALTKEKQKIKQSMQNLGSVNMLALEEYEKIVARKGFIDAQRQELHASITFLQQAADEIEATSAKRFTEVFSSANAEFNQLFPLLFPRGQAQLILEEPDTPLASGVQIMVQLPGKKRQHMNLFSGGEKALTAIALIFSLLKTKPTPFCFLDEVDAALDEANVARFSRVLSSLAERFQFILITHNRKTMSIFDRLYGVTMQEPGVSKVVSVDMRKDLMAST
ncbi:MAG: chromosome segregation protein SMC [Pseudomonadota bacterium]|nr:chromosome segregation protein SMC [Pseudomonadota bacterium]